MDDLSAMGFVLPRTRADFAQNRVVLVTPLNGTIRSFEELASGRIKRIAAGNPKTVPAGRYGAEVFDYYKLSSAVRDKLIYGENVRQVLDYVARGEVDAGIVYATDAATRSAEVRLAKIAPEASHKPVIYPIAVIKGTKNEGEARAFIDEVRSKEGKAILKKYGFITP
jgi:molybdate transport system substrate-binding protein